MASAIAPSWSVCSCCRSATGREVEAALGVDAPAAKTAILNALRGA